jgi:osmoprotectant transport system substrate-binding protein
MRVLMRNQMTRSLLVTLSMLTALACSACGEGTSTSQTAGAPPGSTSSLTSPSSTGTGTGTATTTAAALPGTGKPQVTIGDKNYTEQFVLGELYRQGLEAQGFNVALNQNIGPTQVTLQALKSGSLAMYPEYLNVFDTSVAGYVHGFRSPLAAYQGAQRYAAAHGLELLTPTPFSDTDAIGVTVGYAEANRLRSLGDLAKVARSLTLGGPPQFQQTSPGLPDLEQAYGFTPAAFKPLAIGDQYSSLDDGSVQAADVNTTDGQLASGNYRLLADPSTVFGWGNVVPVLSARAVAAEGPVFVSTIDRISALLSVSVMRQLNQAVDVSGENPSAVAMQFLETHGVIPPASP